MFVTRLIVRCAVLATVFLTGSICYAETRVVINNLDDDSPGSLRREIALAQNGDTIIFDQSLSNQQILLNVSRGSLVVDKSLTITAAALPSRVIINGNRVSGGNFSVIRQTAGTLTVNNLTITGSGPSLSTIGGGINCSSGVALNVINCLVVDNQAFRHGGISAWGNFTMIGTTVSGNSCTSLTGVGGVDADGNNGTATLTINDSIITNNTGGDGGFDANFGIQGTVSNTIIDNNAALLPGTGTGGGFFYNVPNLVFDNCTFKGNTGTGIKVWAGSSLTMTNCEVSNNTTFGMQLQNSWMAMSDSIIHGNQSTQSAVQVRWTNVPTTTITMTNVIIDDNAGIGLDHDAHQATLNNCVITNNQKGGIKNTGHILPEGRMNLNQCVISNNNASAIPNFPGGIHNLSAPMTLTECTVSNNQAVTGAGIFNQAPSLTIADANLTLNYCTVSGNTAASSDGGGIKGTNAAFAPGRVLITLNNCTVSGNSATNGKGGGIYYDGGATASNLTLIASTITQNSAQGVQGIGGGVFVTANPNSIASLNNTIVAGNTDTQTMSPDLSGNCVSNDYNLVSIIDGSNGIDGPNDQTGNLSNPLDPVIDTVLADNGGPTLTHAVLAGSPAIASGDPALQGRDQRGVSRGNPPTVGAYEYLSRDLRSPNPGDSSKSNGRKPYEGYVRKP